MLKRTISLALAAVLALGCLPLTALAQDEQGTGDEYQDALQRRMAQIAPAAEGGAGQPLRQNQRQVLDFNTDWLFIQGDDEAAKEPGYDESAAQEVSLPHAREAYDLYEPDIEGLQTVDWYRRHFTLPAQDEGDRVVVQFNGGGQVNRVYVNGALVGEAKGTFTHFSFDITDYVTFGEYDNVIAVQVDSRYHSGEMPPGKNIDFHFFGGLHGSASLTLTDPLRADSVFYYNDDVVDGCASAVLNGRIELGNDYLQPQQATVRSIVRDAEGNQVSVQEVQAEASNQQATLAELKHTIAAPHLWSTNDPYLYTVETQVLAGGVLLDSQTTCIGLRTFKATSPSDSEGYFTLNGQRIEIIGGNRHMQAPYLGNSLTEKLNVKDAETLKHDLGINFVRTSHYQTDPSFLDACDRLGILVEEEPLGWQDTPGWEQFCYSAEEMVKRDRNHASIVMWSIIPNERNLNYPSIEEGRERQRVTKELDPSRLTIQEEMNQAAVIADVYGWHDYNNPNGSPPVKKPQKAESWFVTEWNTNLGKHFIIPGDSESRKIDQVEQDGLKLSQLAGDKRIMGTLKWDLFGYMTPMSKDERGKNVNLWRCSGVYGHWRDPLHKTWIAYLMAAQAPDPTDVGDILFINSEWKEDSPKTLTVSTNLDAVELYYGTPAGEELVARLDAPNELTGLKNGLFRFDLGERDWAADSYLLAKGYRTGAAQPAKEHKVYASTYASEKEGAQLTVHNTIGDITADGADVAWLLAELTDKNGQREFYGDDNVRAEILSGPGQLVYAGDSPTMADGLSGFYLRSQQDEPGETLIRVEADLGDTLNDDDTAIAYGSGWQRLTGKQDAWKGDYHQAEAGATATITFTGTQLAIYSESQTGGGTAAVLVDGRPAGSLSCANTSKYGTIANQQVWKSPTLEAGEHTVTITAQGRVNIDRLKVFDGAADVQAEVTVRSVADTSARVPSRPSLPDAETPEENSLLALQLLLADAEALDRTLYDAGSLALLDDAVAFAQSVLQMQQPTSAILAKAAGQLRAAVNQLQPLAVTRIEHTRTCMEGQTGGVYYYAKDPATWVTGEGNTYAKKGRTDEDFYSITFEGVKIELYSQMDSAHGQVAISVDGGPEVLVDQYHAQQVTGELFWQSDVLEYGTHTVKVRVTGVSTGNPDNACASFGHALVYEAIDPVQQAKTLLAETMARADVLDRGAYTAASLDALDQALVKAEALLRDAGASEEAVREAQAALDEILQNQLEPGQQGGYTVTCLDEDKADQQGTLNKIYYSSQAADDWVVERESSEALRNRYLKKAATKQEPAPYAELMFEGTGVEVFARFSQTSGYAWVEVKDSQGKLVDAKHDISLYDADIGNGVPGTRAIYALQGLAPGRYTLRLYPENKPHDPTTDLTSINLAHVAVTTGQSPQQPDTAGLQAAVQQLNAAVLDGRHAQTKASFEANVIRLVANSYGLLEGGWPNVKLVDSLPAGTTDTRVDRITADVQAVLDALAKPLTVQQVGPVADITVPQGTQLEALGLPALVMVLSSDQQGEKLPVTWSCPSYDPDIPGNYPFEGSLTMPQGMTNPQGLKASLTVTVTEPEARLYDITATVEGGEVQVTVPTQAAQGDTVTVQIGQLPQGTVFDGIEAFYTPDGEPTEPAGEPAEPAGEPAEPAGEPAEPSGEPAEPSGEPTEPAGEPAELSGEPTEPSGEPTEPDKELAAHTGSGVQLLAAPAVQVPAMRSGALKLGLTTVEEGKTYTFTMPAGPVQLTVRLKNIPVQQVLVQGGSGRVAVGGQLVLTAQVQPEGAAYDAVQWNVEGDAAQGVNRAAELVLTGVKPGQVTVTATAGGVTSAPFVVTVDPAPTPTPGGSGGAQATPSPTAAPAPTPAATQKPPRATPSPTERPQATPKPTVQPSPTAQPSEQPSPTEGPQATPSPTAQPAQAGPGAGPGGWLVVLGLLAAAAAAVLVVLLARRQGRR